MDLHKVTMTASGVAGSSAGARPLASAAFTVFREIPITCAICAIGICSARLSRRISAQSSPLSTCFLPDSARARLSGKLVKFQLPPTCRSDRQRLPDRWDGQGSSGTGDAGGQPQPEGSAGRLWRFQSSVAVDTDRAVQAPAGRGSAVPAAGRPDCAAALTFT